MSNAEQSLGPRPVSRPKRRRLSSHLINGDLRLRLVLDDAIFALAAALTAIGILYYMSNREIGDTMFSAHLSIKETRELLTNGVKVAGLVTFAAVLVFGLWSVVDAHRIAGPLHRLHRLLNEIGDGNLVHEIAFRRRDEFAELAVAADRMVEAYAERLGAIRAQAATLQAGLEVTPLSEQQALALRQQAAELSSLLAYFKLPEQETGPEIDGRPLSDTGGA